VWTLVIRVCAFWTLACGRLGFFLVRAHKETRTNRTTTDSALKKRVFVADGAHRLRDNNMYADEFPSQPPPRCGDAPSTRLASAPRRVRTQGGMYIGVLLFFLFRTGIKFKTFTVSQAEYYARSKDSLR